MKSGARKSKSWTGLQDGILAWYQSQVGQSDVSVERKLETETFDFRDVTRAADARRPYGSLGRLNVRLR